MSDTVLRRLRAANPFPDPPLRVESPVVRRLRRRIVVVAVAVVTIGVLASAAYGISQWLGGDVVKSDVTLSEYRQAQRVLPLPPGYEWPTLHVDPNSVTTRGGGGGYAVLNAEIAWDCYWVGAIRRGDGAAQANAHRHVDDLLRHNVIVAPVGASENWSPPNPPDRPFAVFAHDGGFEWLRTTYALAAAGHPERLAQRCAANR